MSLDDSTSIDDLNNLLEQIEKLSPTYHDTEGKAIRYRPVGSEEIIDDALPADEFTDTQSDFTKEEIPSQETSEVIEFRANGSGPIVAIDCGIARLGETENGLVVALRATIVTQQNGESRVALFRTGPIYLHNHYKKELLFQMGKHLGKPDHFVEVDAADPENIVPMRVKSGMAHDAHKYGDRFRNWFERLTQRIGVTQIENGIVLLDGALTLRTVDTPDIFLNQLADVASSKGNALIAISKQSMLQVQDRPVQFWLKDSPGIACYRCLTPHMRDEESERVLGNCYATRFSVLGPTFRTDVKSTAGQSDSEALSLLYGSAFMRGGYPDILVQAHTHSYFTSPDVIQLQATAGAKYRLTPQAEPDLTGIFGPFGGRFK